MLLRRHVSAIVAVAKVAEEKVGKTVAMMNTAATVTIHDRGYRSRSD